MEYTNWLDLAGKRFSKTVKSIIDDNAKSLLSTDMLGGEDTQCQHLFTSIFLRLQQYKHQLTDFLNQDSLIPQLKVEFRYYRSHTRRNSTDRPVQQFVEKETGADFAFTLCVDLPNVAFTQRHVLAQAKLIKSSKLRVDLEQLATLNQAARGELGLYTIWGETHPPAVITVANMKAAIRSVTGRRSFTDTFEGGSELRLNWETIERFSRPLADYAVDEFLGLWHGADFYPEEYDENPPSGSIPILYHHLHMGTPPPNTIYFGFSQVQQDGETPGFYAHGFDLPGQTPVTSFRV